MGPRFAPREVSFAHPVPLDTTQHERIFRCPVRFEAPLDAIMIDTTHMD
jgi:hypothetical protein